MNGNGVVDHPQIAGVNPATVPGVTQAEFGPRPMSKDTVAELAALEKSINEQLTSGIITPPAAAPAPVAPPPVVAAPQLAPVVAPPAPVADAFAAPAAVPVLPGTPVPAKFLNPDGTMDLEKVQKSTAALNDYLAREQQFHALRANPSGLPPQVPQGYIPDPRLQQLQPQYAPQPQVPLEARVNEDLRNNPGATVLNLYRAAVMQAQAESSAATKVMATKLELMEIGQNDPGVFTKEGLDRLAQVRIENPWLDHAPTPWLAAYKLNGPIAPRNAAPQHATVPVGAQPAPARTAAPIVPGGQPQPSVPAGAQSIASEADLRRYMSLKFPNNPQGQANYLEQVMRAQVGG